MTPKRPKVAVFSEERFEQSPAGVFYAQSPSTSGDAWREILPENVDGVLVARARVVESPAGHAVHGQFFPLPYYVGPWQTLKALWSTRRAVRLALRDSDVALVKAPGVIGALVSRETKSMQIPLAVQVVGDASGVLRSGVAGRLLRSLTGFADWVTRRVVRRAQLVRYVPAARLRARYPSAPGAAVHVFSDVVIAAEPIWSPILDSPRIVTVGSADQLYKGHHLLIRALPAIRDSVPGTTLRIIGSGRLLPELRKIAHESAVSDQVEFTGFVSDKSRLNTLVGESTLFVLASLTEGMPRALVEAMALGVPAVASRVGGVPDVLADHATFEPGDVQAMTDLITALLADEELLRARSREGLAAVKAFDGDARESSLSLWKRDLSRIGTRIPAVRETPHTEDKEETA